MQHDPVLEEGTQRLRSCTDWQSLAQRSEGVSQLVEPVAVGAGAEGATPTSANSNLALPAPVGPQKDGTQTPIPLRHDAHLLPQKMGSEWAPCQSECQSIIRGD